MATRYPVIVPPKFTSVNDVISGLSELEKVFIARQDRRSVFASTYVITTVTFKKWLDERRFLNNELVACYVVAFANLYREAVAGYEAGDREAVPVAWQQSFDSARDANVSVYQNLVLGINAHINHDLPYAVLNAGLDVHCDQCYQDHTRMNDALRSATPRVRQRIASVYQPSLHVMNWLYGWTINEAVVFAFERARQIAWQSAQTLAATEGLAEQIQVGNRIKDRAALAGRMILGHRRAPDRCLAFLYEVEKAMPAPSQVPRPIPFPSQRATGYNISQAALAPAI
jgi:hypothetical protein